MRIYREDWCRARTGWFIADSGKFSFVRAAKSVGELAFPRRFLGPPECLVWRDENCAIAISWREWNYTVPLSGCRNTIETRLPNESPFRCDSIPVATCVETLVFNLIRRGLARSRDGSNHSSFQRDVKNDNRGVMKYSIRRFAFRKFFSISSKFKWSLLDERGKRRKWKVAEIKIRNFSIATST